MSRLLMANSCTMQKIKKMTTNQAGIADWWAKGRKAFDEVPTVVRNVPRAAPRVMIRISGTAVPTKIQPTIDLEEALGLQ